MPDHDETPGPDEFERIIAGLDARELESAAIGPQPIPNTTAPAPAAPAAPARPQRPALVEPVAPAVPELGRVAQTGHWASLLGYTLSVAVGAFGQIMFLGTWLSALLGSPWCWVAAAVGAAFCEVGMIGAGNSSLVKRRDGGSWRLLMVVACFVCAAAVTMQIAHWSPYGFGVAVVFGLASFVGFLIHMVIEHGKLADHEHRQAAYGRALAAYRDEVQRRYEEDLAEYQAARPRAQQPTSPAPAVRAKPAAKPKPASRAGGKPKLTAELAREWSAANDHPGPSAVRTHFHQSGYHVPAVSTLRGWLNHKEAPDG